MTSPVHDNPDDARLWQRVGLPNASDASSPDAIDLAAYVEGRLDDAARARVEAYLATNAQARRGLGEVRDLLAAPAMNAPAGILAAAKSLVPARRGGSVAGSSRRWRVAMQATGAAAAAVLIGLAGYFAGAGTYRSQQQTEQAVVTAVSFDLTDPEDDPLLAADEFDLALARNGEGGK